MSETYRAFNASLFASGASGKFLVALRRVILTFDDDTNLLVDLSALFASNGMKLRAAAKVSGMIASARV